MREITPLRTEERLGEAPLQNTHAALPNLTTKRISLSEFQKFLSVLTQLLTGA